MFCCLLEIVHRQRVGLCAGATAGAPCRALATLQVAQDLLDKGKSFNLAAAVLRKFCPSQLVQGPPKAKSNVEGTVFHFHLPAIGWVDFSDFRTDVIPACSEPARHAPGLSLIHI